MKRRKASIHDFIMTLPKGCDTNVGELGDLLSDGEKQRILESRQGVSSAYAPMIMLDEPTVTYDSLNRGHILRSINRG